MTDTVVNHECPAAKIDDSIVTHPSQLHKYILDRAVINTDNDPIYCFNRELMTKGKFQFVDANVKTSVVIAGSAAIKLFTNTFNWITNWVSKDIDLFFLNSDGNFRHDLKTVDIVAKKVKDVPELLASFDLPCCRMAYDEKYFWASEQALRATFSTRYSLPKIYLNMKKLYLDKGFDNNMAIHLADRFQERVDKYNSRGYIAVYDNTLTKTSAIDQFDPKASNYGDEVKNVVEPKLINAKATTAKQADAENVITSATAQPVINSSEISANNKVDIIDLIFTKVAPLIVDGRDSVYNIMEFVASLDRDRRLPILFKTIATYPDMIKLSKSISIVDYMKMVNKLY